MNPPASPPNPHVTNAFLALGFLFGVYLIVYAVREVRGDSALSQGSVTVQATITASQIMTSRKRGDSYQVRYAFDVGGRTYTYRDGTGREDLWVSLERSAWEASRQSGKVAVRYSPSDPWVNRAVDQANEGLFGQVVAALMGLLCMSPAVLAVVGAVRGRRRAVAAPGPMA